MEELAAHTASIAMVSPSVVSRPDSSLTMHPGSGIEYGIDSTMNASRDLLPVNKATTSQNSKGEPHRTNNIHATLAEVARLLCDDVLAGSDHPVPEEGTDDMVLSAAEAEELTLRFLFGDSAGPKATGPNGAASRSTLKLLVTGDEVCRSIWPSRRSEIKALLADEQGRFDKKELLAHIVNNLLGRPLLFRLDASAVGTAAENALAKEKKETAQAKKMGGAAVSSARAAASRDPSLLPRVAAAEAASKAAQEAVLRQTYDLKLPNSTVGAKRKQVPAAETLRCVLHAQYAVQTSAEQLERKQHELDSLGSPPNSPPKRQLPGDIDNTLGEAHASRRYDRQRTTYNQATADVRAAERALSERQQEAATLQEAALECSLAQEEASVDVEEDPECVDLADDREWAEFCYLEALLAPPSGTWVDTFGQKLDAAKAAEAAYGKARAAKLAPFEAGYRRAEDAYDAYYADPRTADPGPGRVWCGGWRVWIAREESVRQEYDRTYAEWARHWARWPYPPAAAKALMKQQEACYCEAWDRQWAWESEQYEAKRRSVCGCVCDQHCCTHDYDCRRCLVARTRQIHHGYRSE